MGALDSSKLVSPVVGSPDLRLRVFVSSTLELADEGIAVRDAVETLGLTPVSPAHFDEADVFVGIYWQGFGSVEDALSGAVDKPRLVYVKEPAPDRDPRLETMLEGFRSSGVTLRTFGDVEQLRSMVVDDLAMAITERFHAIDRHTLSAGRLTFLFADLEGSTVMLQRLGETYQTLLGDFHRLVNGTVAAHEGHVVTTEGDGFFCLFSSTTEAVKAAHDIQVAMAEATWPGDEHPRCRIGIHTGTAARTLEGYVGIDVHVAARIGAAAQGGQVLVSAAVVDEIRDHAAAVSWSLVDLGHYELRGIGRSERLYRIDSPELAVVATAPRARPRTSSSVPATPRPLIGRDADVNGASEMLLREGTRLVTITGTGGTGKTRLAVELARALDDEFPDGTTFVDLSGVSDPERFLPVVGRALGIRESAERTITEALQSIIGDDRILLVLDNMEQILAAAPQVAELLSAMPNAKILVTSRSPLRISWEHEYPLPPLSVPPPGSDYDDVDQADAVRLFVERALAARPHFELNEVTRGVVAEITRRLDGLPLAIEITAARLRVFSVEELLDRLDDKLGFEARESSGVPDRHRSLRGAIRWSYDLLADDEKAVFRRLSVFVGGWSLDASLHVCCDEALTESRVLDILEDLVAKSLVVFTIDEQGNPRYRLLETLREFGIEELAELGEETEIRLRHLAWCRLLAERMNTVLPTPDFPPYLDEVERERFNLREALAWSARTRQGTDDALMVCGMLPLFWDTRGYVSEGLRWIRALIAMTTAEGITLPRGIAHTAMGWLEMLAGEGAESDWALETAVRMFRDLDDESWLGRALSMQGMTTYNLGRLEEAEEQFDEAIVLLLANDIGWLADVWCRYGLAHIAMARNEFEKAGTMLVQCFEYSRAHGLTWGVGHTQLSLGVLAFMMGDTDRSVERIVESTLVRQKLRDSRGICDCLGMMALHASVRGDHSLAAVLLGAAEVAREASGDHTVPWLQPLLEQAEVSAKSALGSTYESRIVQGRALSVDQAVTLIVESFSRVDTAGAVVSA